LLKRRYRVQWLKSWTEQQSVPGLKYLHVVVRDALEEIVRNGLAVRKWRKRWLSRPSEAFGAFAG
jgi:hypothetical protein